MVISTPVLYRRLAVLHPPAPCSGPPSPGLRQPDELRSGGELVGAERCVGEADRSATPDDGRRQGEELAAQAVPLQDEVAGRYARVDLRVETLAPRLDLDRGSRPRHSRDGFDVDPIAVGTQTRVGHAGIGEGG